MPPRIHHPLSDPKEAAEIRLDATHTHHLVRVLRLQPGDVFDIFDGAGNLYAARLSRIEQGTAWATFDPKPVSATVPKVSITLLQALPKADKLEWIIQKGTELGVAAFVVFPALRSVATLPQDKALRKAERWRKIAEEAARQSRRADIPALATVASLAEALTRPTPGSSLILLDEEEREVRFKEVLDRSPSPMDITLIIGPEGGWERSEVQQCHAAGGVPASLGPRTLRVETASLAALSVVLHRSGELG